MVGLEAGRGIDRDATDLLGLARRDLLDVHAAGGAADHDRSPGRAVDEHGDVQLALDGGLLFDEDAADELALGAGLRRDESHADDLGRGALGLVRRVGELDAAALAATAGVDLRLDDDGLADLLRDRSRVPGSRCDAAARDGDAVLGEDLLGLVLVDLHDDRVKGQGSWVKGRELSGVSVVSWDRRYRSRPRWVWKCCCGTGRTIAPASSSTGPRIASVMSPPVL